MTGMDRLPFHKRSDITCPRCGTSLLGLATETTVAVGDERQHMRVHVHCPDGDCAAPLDLVLVLVLDATQPDGATGRIYVEDGHRAVGQDR